MPTQANTMTIRYNFKGRNVSVNRALPRVARTIASLQRRGAVIASVKSTTIHQFS